MSDKARKRNTITTVIRFLTVNTPPPPISSYSRVPQILIPYPPTNKLFNPPTTPNSRALLTAMFFHQGLNNTTRSRMIPRILSLFIRYRRPRGCMIRAWEVHRKGVVRVVDSRVNREREFLGKLMLATRFRIRINQLCR